MTLRALEKRLSAVHHFVWPCSLLALALPNGGCSSPDSPASPTEPAGPESVEVRSEALATTLGNLTAFSPSGSTFTLSAGADKVRIRFLQPDVFRMELAPGGTFTDPVAGKVLQRTDFGQVPVTHADAGDYYRIESDALVLRAYKKPLTFALYKKDNATLLWREQSGLSWDDQGTQQKLVRGADEQFYGGGLRLGAWALRDLTVPIKVFNSWKEGENASPAPFYMSTAGYGVVRNTWTAGSYQFGATVSTRHGEKRFDAVYFAAGHPKEVLDRYTDVTGKPFLAPLFGLEMGHADCWSTHDTDPDKGPVNRAGHLRTPDVIAYAQAARDNDMPGGWFLPNDGYGCNYEDLPSTVKSLHDRGFYTGLWTSTGLANVAWEVGTAGTRAIKTDVAWIGRGYKFAFEGVEQAVAGIESNSNARRFVWTVDGWAGTQRNAVVWTGDTKGDWNDMRFHVPALAGAGLSALNYASGDVDGIYYGSPDTYSRDLQWKSFLPVLMSMSGWGNVNPERGYNDKQPWRFDDAHKAIHRKYLKLRQRLLPYLYTMSRIAHETGVPSTRAMVLEYPNDPKARDNTTSQQFMAGDAFLVAPVTSNTATRDGIYLPQGTWTDYWSGKVYVGPATVNGYAAPLDRLPLFVRAGSIVPMWPQMLHHREKPKDPITLDIYPPAQAGSASFSLYEDDGVTRDYAAGRYAKQAIRVEVLANGTMAVAVGPSQGDYTGKPTSRRYELTIHMKSAPARVVLDTTALTYHASRAAYDAASEGWFFDPADRSGVLSIKIPQRSLSTSFGVSL
ncbi:TIM-barrel domain-containing protein [Pendulispora albinea]|uniref:DUF5110 domain-containing protein n=1 Tax=Pendulispora albinea TaxID=2741071 RepID=A0ABZ2M4N6_9BACT